MYLFNSSSNQNNWVDQWARLRDLLGNSVIYKIWVCKSDNNDHFILRFYLSQFLKYYNLINIATHGLNWHHTNFTVFLPTQFLFLRKNFLYKEDNAEFIKQLAMAIWVNLGFQR